MEVTRGKVRDLIGRAEPDSIPLAGDFGFVAGEWNLVLTTVKHEIFRSSPFFLAVQGE